MDKPSKIKFRKAPYLMILTVCIRPNRLYMKNDGDTLGFQPYCGVSRQPDPGKSKGAGSANSQSGVILRINEHLGSKRRMILVDAAYSFPSEMQTYTCSLIVWKLE